MADVLEVALQLLDNGFTPLRIEPGQKMPTSQGWQTDTPTKEKLTRVFNRPSNIGIRMGDALPDGTYLVGIDVDIEEHALHRAVRMAIGESVPVKKGKKGATYIVRFNAEVRTHKIRWVREGKNVPAIDILGRGSQTVLPPSIHPQTGQPYIWVSGTPLTDITIREIPVFNDTLLDEIKGFCKNPEDKVYALNDMLWAGVGGGGNTHDTCVEAVSSMVARQWREADIIDRIIRAKREAAEVAGLGFDWPEAQKTIQEWIDSAKDKKFDVVTKRRSEGVPGEWLDNYAYVVEIDQIIDRKRGTMFKRPQFDNYHAREMPKPWIGMMSHPDLVAVDKITYAPGQPKICKELSTRSNTLLDCFNLYYPSDIQPDEGDASPWVNLVKDICDREEKAYNHVFDWCAHLLQFPGERINHALFIQGEQGIGKDTMFLALKVLLGSSNYSHVSLEQVESGFNEWVMGKQLVVFQEMMAAGRRHIYNKLKPTITDEELQINIKHMPLLRFPNRGNYVFLSNYQYAMSIDRGDRRLWIWFSKMKPKPPAYYAELYRWLNDPKSYPALLHWLLDRDLSKFNPKAPPPMTLAKEAMVRASAPEIEQYLRAAAEAGTWPLQYDIVSATHIAAAVRPLFRVSQNMVNDALDSIFGSTQITVRPYFGAKRPRLRVIRDIEKWQSADLGEVAEYYRVPVPPMSTDSEGGYTKYDKYGSDPGSPDY